LNNPIKVKPVWFIIALRLYSILKDIPCISIKCFA